MFKKLVANLPFNPSLINQVGFYSDRLRQEKTIRRMSFVFMALAMTVQSLAVISPPEKSLAFSNNHIMNGIQTKTDIALHFLNPSSDITNIFARFNLTIDDVSKLSEKPNDTIRSNSGEDWWTIGRSSLFGYSNVADVYKNSQKQLQYGGVGTATTADDASVYARQLRAWDIKNSYNTYEAWRGTSAATGQTFWILKDCGNITWIGDWKVPPAPTPPPAPKPTPTPSPTPTPTPTPSPTPTPTPAKPELEMRKSISGNPATLKPGDSLTYRIEYRNKIIGTTAKDVYIEDDLETEHFDLVSPKNLSINNGYIKQSVGSLLGSANFEFLEITVRLKNPLASPTNVCNASSLTSSNASRVNSRPVCVNVITPCPYDATVPNVNNPNCTKPVIVCTVVDSAINRTTREVTYKTTVTSSNEATTRLSSYNYEFGDGTKLTQASKGFTDTAVHTFEPGKFNTKVTVTYEATGLNGKQEVSCQTPIEFDEDEPLGEQKTVSNITRGLSGKDALGTAVRAGDELQYTLTTLNSQNYDRENVTVSDYIGDILDYATLDTAALEAQGGRYDKDTKKVIWKDIKIGANSKVESKFTVKLLNPIPSTNRPSKVSNDYDCRISNFYGNDITLEVQCPVVKGLETIPNTGPGTSLLIGTLITGFVGYFFARTRLLHKELNLIRTDYATTGGL